MSLMKGTLAALALSGCHSIELNDDRIPRTAVYVPFTTVADWETYGVSGALQSRRFIREDKVPANYPYPDYSYTGYGGLLLVSDVNSEPRCFDLSCPVERQRDIRVVIDRDENLARCPRCHSTYDVFGILGPADGRPTSGPALTAGTNGYALRHYRVLFGADSRYALLSL